MSELEELLKQYSNVVKKLNQYSERVSEYQSRVKEMYTVMVNRVTRLLEAQETLEREGLWYLLRSNYDDIELNLDEINEMKKEILKFEVKTLMEKIELFFDRGTIGVSYDGPSLDTFVKKLQQYLDSNGFNAPILNDETFSKSIGVSSQLPLSWYHEAISNVLRRFKEHEKGNGIDIDYLLNDLTPEYNELMRKKEELFNELISNEDFRELLSSSLFISSVSKAMKEIEKQRKLEELNKKYSFVYKFGDLFRSEFSSTNRHIAIPTVMRDSEVRRYETLSSEGDSEYISQYFIYHRDNLPVDVSFEAEFLGMSLALITYGISLDDFKTSYLTKKGDSWDDFVKMYTFVKDNFDKFELTEYGLNKLKEFVGE